MATKTMKIGLSNADKNTMSSQVALETINKLIDAYSTSKQYSVGDYVNNAGVIYVCIEATSGAWDSTKWSIATLNQVIDKINQAANSVENKAEKDGYYETFGYAREAGIAKNLQNDEGKLLDPDVDTSSGTTYADAPFVQRATSMTMKAYLDNELITVGSGYEQWRKEQAFSIVRNQRVKRSNVLSNGITMTFADGKYTFSGTATGTAIIPIGFPVLRHKMFIYINYINNPNNKRMVQDDTGHFANPTIYIHYSTNVNAYYISFIEGETADLTIECSIIDLTQWFASKPEIATSLSGDAGVKWFLQNYPEALSLGYDEGTIVDTEDYEYQTTGVNLWDEEWELGYYDSNGVKQNDDNMIRSKNYIPVFPNTSYYCKANTPSGLIFRLYDENKKILSTISSIKNTTFITPLNCFFITFCTFDVDNIATYNNDIQICNHFTETSVEQTYHKYEIFKDRVSWAFTSTGKGKSAGNVADTKDYVNKKNIEKVGQVDLGTLNWGYNSQYTFFFASINGIAKSGSGLLCSLYNTIPHTQSLSNDFEIKLNGSGGIYITNKSYSDATSFKTAMSGVILNYELATYIETDMSGDELDTNIPENDYGVERKVSVSGNMFSGSATTIFYQDNVLRQIYNNNGSIDNLQEGLNTIEARIPVAPTTDGTYTLKAVVSNGVATYSWTLDSQGG